MTSPYSSEAIMQSVTALIVVLEEDGRIRQINRACEQTTGFQSDEVRGQPFGETLLLDTDVLKSVKQQLKNGEIPNPSTDRWACKNGSHVTVEWTGRILNTSNEHRGGQPMVITGNDVTRRREAELDRESHVEQLERKNAELERFSYTVAHDLKTPLVTMKGFLKLLIPDIESNNIEGVGSNVERILRSVDHMQHLLDDLLELSRVGRTLKPATNVSLSSLAQQAVDCRSDEIAAQRIDVDVAADLPRLRGDATRLLEVFQNLVDNAVRFTQDATDPRIEIGQRIHDEKVVFTVCDNGIGIDSCHAEKIFGLFEQLHPERGGTGIGLTIVKRIVEMHGGRVWVESDGPDTGCTFCFTLPATTGSD